MQASDIDVVCISANGMQQFDRPELEGIKSVFGSNVAMVAPKGIYGETLGASGALGMATALSWFEGVKIEPVVCGKAPERLVNALVTTVGFYGNASAVIMRRCSPTSS